MSDTLLDTIVEQADIEEEVPVVAEEEVPVIADEVVTKIVYENNTQVVIEETTEAVVNSISSRNKFFNKFLPKRFF